MEGLQTSSDLPSLASEEAHCAPSAPTSSPKQLGLVQAGLLQKEDSKILHVEPVHSLKKILETLRKGGSHGRKSSQRQKKKKSNWEFPLSFRAIEEKLQRADLFS